MSHYPYQPPQAALDDSAASPADTADFYVVSPRKFLILMIGTLGLYQVYWFYRNWTAQNREGQYWPIPRAIFSVLYTHALFRLIEGAQSRARLAWSWVPMQAANAYVIGIVGSQLCGRLAAKGMGLPLTNLLSLALLAPAIWGLYQAQCALNAACGDPAGERNQQITGANLGWLALGGLLWALTLLGLALAVLA